MINIVEENGTIFFQQRGLENEVYDATENLKSDIRFTSKGNCVYVIARNWFDNKVIVKNMAEGIIEINPSMGLSIKVAVKNRM